ncbi:MAG: hypothetical protein MK137_08370, partial [Rickettsiales bacterium]|nr:hypothetical protein [Rickettsiales bacterium]
SCFFFFAVCLGSERFHNPSKYAYNLGLGTEAKQTNKKGTVRVPVASHIPSEDITIITIKMR